MRMATMSTFLTRPGALLESSAVSGRTSLYYTDATHIAIHTRSIDSHTHRLPRIARTIGSEMYAPTANRALDNYEKGTARSGRAGTALGHAEEIA